MNRALTRTAALIEARGGIRPAREFAERYAERSLREISRLPCGEERNVLEKAAEKLLHRTR